MGWERLVGADPVVYAGGGFTVAGGLASSHLAAWWCSISIFADGFETGDVSAWSIQQP